MARSLGIRDDLVVSLLLLSSHGRDAVYSVQIQCIMRTLYTIR